MADVIKLPLPGGPPQLPAPCGVFAYAGRGNCTAIQVADDSMGQALLFLASAGVIGEVRQTTARGRTTDLEVSVKRRDGTAEFVVLPGDVILFLDDEPEQFTVVTAGMFGALFKTGPASEACPDCGGRPRGYHTRACRHADNKTGE